MSSPFDFIVHEESYKLRSFLKNGIFDHSYANDVHQILFGKPIFSDKQNYLNRDRPLIMARRRLGKNSTFKAYRKRIRYGSKPFNRYRYRHRYRYS